MKEFIYKETVYGDGITTYMSDNDNVVFKSVVIDDFNTDNHRYTTMEYYVGVGSWANRKTLNYIVATKDQLAEQDTEVTANMATVSPSFTANSNTAYYKTTITAENKLTINTASLATDKITAFCVIATLAASITSPISSTVNWDTNTAPDMSAGGTYWIDFWYDGTSLTGKLRVSRPLAS